MNNEQTKELINVLLESKIDPYHYMNEGPEEKTDKAEGYRFYGFYIDKFQVTRTTSFDIQKREPSNTFCLTIKDNDITHIIGGNVNIDLHYDLEALFQHCAASCRLNSIRKIKESIANVFVAAESLIKKDDNMEKKNG